MFSSLLSQLRVTCEEFSIGQVHEVNPFTGVSSQQQTVLGNSGGKYESFAYDARDLTSPTFYGEQIKGMSCSITHILVSHHKILLTHLQ